MIQIDDMATFVAVVETGSLTAAAMRLDTTKSVVSRRLADLERELGAILLERGARGARPTEVGAVYYAKCLRILESIHAASDFVAGFNEMVSGSLKIVVARSFHETQIAALLNCFAFEHSEIVLQVESSRAGALGEIDYDVALLSGSPDNTDLIARPLFEFANVLCASREYLERHGMPHTAADLAGHDGLFESDGVTGWSHRRGEQLLQLRAKERMVSSDPQQLLSAVRAGLGILQAPEPVIADDLASGRLQRLLPGMEMPRGQFALLYPRSRRASRKVQLLAEFLRGHLDSVTTQV